VQQKPRSALQAPLRRNRVDSSDRSDLGIFSISHLAAQWPAAAARLVNELIKHMCEAKAKGVDIRHTTTTAAANLSARPIGICALRTSK
jgi:hypothetical protein